MLRSFLKRLLLKSRFAEVLYIWRIVRRLANNQRNWSDPRVALGASTIDPLARIDLPPSDRPDKIVEIGFDVYIGPNVVLSPDSGIGIWIGDHASLNSHIEILGSVSIGRSCTLASYIYISSGRHYFDLFPEKLIREQDRIALSDPVLSLNHSKRVIIDEDVWIGRGVYIGQGVRIGRGVVVGANSVVTRDVPPYTVVGGIPARRIKSRLDFDPPLSISAKINGHFPYFYSGFRFENGIAVALKEASIAIPFRDSGKLMLSGQNRSEKPVSLVLEIAGNCRRTLIVETGNYSVTYTFSQELTSGQPWVLFSISGGCGLIVVENLQLVEG